MPDQSSVELRFSGEGVATGSASLGGVVSAFGPQSQRARGSVPAGVTFVDANTTAGAGTLTFTATGQTLAWTPFGGSIGAAVSVGAGGRFALTSGTGYVLVDVTAAALPAIDTTASLTIRALQNVLFTDAPSNATDYCCLYVYAVAAVSEVSIGLAQPNGLGSLAHGLDPAGVGGTAQTVLNRTTAPTGVTFQVENLAVGAMTAGQSVPFWLRRVSGTGSGDVAASVSVSFA